LKLAAKIILTVAAGLLLLLAVDGYLTVRREISLFEADKRHDALLLGNAVRGVLAEAWLTGGRESALELIDDIGRNEPGFQVRWVELNRGRNNLYAPDAPWDSLGSLLEGRNVALGGIPRDGGMAFYTYVPLQIEGRLVGAVEVSASRMGLHEYVRTTIFRRIILIVVMLMISSAVIVILGIGFIGRPLHRLMETTQEMGAGNLSASVQLHGHDEFDELARGLNAMGRQLKISRDQLEAETARRITAVEQLRHEDRLRTVGRLASGIAHELGTPLNVIAGRAGLISSAEMPKSEIAESADVIRAQADRMTKIIRQLLDFARRPSSGKTKVDLKECAGNVQKLLQPLAQKRGISVTIGPSETANVIADAAQIDQVLSNLTVNAIQASPRGGRVEIVTGRQSVTPPEGSVCLPGVYAFVLVEDEGEGISKENIEHLFEPFFTTKDVGEGTGLGLSIAYSIVQDHGGWIDVRNLPERGSRFTVYLPEV